MSFIFTILLNVDSGAGQIQLCMLSKYFLTDWLHFHLKTTWFFWEAAEWNGCSNYLKLGAHESILLKQSVIRGTLLTPFAYVCDEIFVRNWSFVAKSTISNMFDNFCHSWHFASLVRRTKAFCFRQSRTAHAPDLISTSNPSIQDGCLSWSRQQ